jgi:ankyrin repeat protein
VDARTHYGLTPLHFAVRGHALEAAAALLARGALLSLPSMFDGEWLDCPRGTTPLHLAARLGQQDLALLILQQYVSRGGVWRLQGS